MNTNRIFISYSHRGNGPEWKEKLLSALQVFERQHLLDVWQDGRIRVSSYWEDDIERAMAEAQLAVVLLTKEALESEFILTKELPRLGERQQHDNLPVFPVICEPCDWRSHDWLRATQAPNASNPLCDLKPEAQEHSFRQLATAIAEELSRGALASFSSGAVPANDAKIYLDKFPLTRSSGLREEKLIGREQELALLDLAFAQPHTAIVSLVAWGGVGKTMLVQHWLQRLQREGWFGVHRVFAWSFYSQGTQEDRQASEDLFLAHALEWFGVQCEPTLSPWDKGRLLADAVARERTLLLLDGIEPLQYPPGPMGGQLRAPGVQSLLKQLARRASAIGNQPSAISNTLCLVTTREPLTDLADFQRREGSPWGSVLRVDLGNLTDEAGAALLHHAGAKRAGAAEIKPDDTELLAASREVDGHALTLNLVGRFLARAHGSDIRRRDLVKFEEADRSERGGTTFKILAAFEAWLDRSGGLYKQSLAVLRLLGLFDRPADAGCLTALRKPPAIPRLTEPLFIPKTTFLGFAFNWQPLSDEDWNTTISFLRDFGLINFAQDCNASSVDCHPLIREHFCRELQGSYKRSWRASHRRLYAHLCASTKEGDLPTIQSLQPLYQAVVHGCHADRRREAFFKVFVARIQRGTGIGGFYSTNKLGAFGSDLAAIASFFDEPWCRVSADMKNAEQSWLLGQSGFRLRALGRLTEALNPMRIALEIDDARKNWAEAAASASNLSESSLILGEIAEALKYAERSVAYAFECGNAFLRCVNRVTMGDALHQAGKQSEAGVRFRQAEQMQAQRQPNYPYLHTLANFRFCELLMDKAERAAWQTGSLADTVRSAELVGICNDICDRAKQSLQWAGTAYRQSLLDSALDHLTLSRASLYAAILDNGALQSFRSEIDAAVLDGAMSRLRRSASQHYIPCGLLTRSWRRCLEGDADGACADLDEAWEIASRGPMRLHMADIHLHRARLFFREKHYPWESPHADLAAAEKLINDCGYHRRDEELADAKRAILGS